MQAGASSSAALCGHLVRAWPCRFDLARAFSHSAWTQGSLCRWHIRRVSVLELWSQHLERSPLICAPVRPSENFFFLHRTPACGPPAPPPIAECLRPAPLPPPPPVTTPVPRSTTAPPARYTRLYFGSTAASGRRYGPVPAIDARWEPPTFTATGGNRAAARHLNGRAILYGDRITKSMAKAIDETDRRRTIQQAHNEKHGIEPQALVKRITDIMDVGEEAAPQDNLKLIRKESNKVLSAKEIASQIKELESKMHGYASDLEFEKAASVRDQIHELQQQLIN